MYISLLKIMVGGIFLFGGVYQSRYLIDDKNPLPEKVPTSERQQFTIDNTMSPPKTDNTPMRSVNFLIHKKNYTVKFYDTPTTKELFNMTPLSMDMSDFNGNEKMYVLTQKLPVSEISPSEIKAGDIMLWQDNTVVLFYESFKTSYSYTKIGYFEDITGLKEDLGKGKVFVEIR